MKDKLIAILVSRVARIVLPLVALAIGLVITFQSIAPSVPTFTAKARLWIPNRMVTMASGEEAAPPTSSPLTSGPFAMKTACEIIHSDAVTKRVYEEFKKAVGDKCPTQSEIQSSLTAKPVDATDILEVEYTAGTEELALAGLQAGLDAFLAENNNQVIGPLQESKERLEQQLKIAQNEYSKAKHKFKSFQDSTSSMDIVADGAALSTERSDLEKAVAETEHELKALKSKLEVSQKQLGFGPESVVAVSKLADDEIMKGLRQSVAEVEVNLIQLRSKYQDEHPKVKRLKASLEEAKKGLQERYATIVGQPELKESMLGVSADSAQRHIVDDMAEASTGIASLEAKLISLNQSLSRVKSRLATMPAQQMEMADIHRTDELATNALTSIERELQKIRLTETVATNDSAIQTIDPPKISATVSTKQNITTGLGTSVLSALLVAAIQFLLLPKKISTAQVVSLLPFDTVGFVPKPAVEGDTKGLTSAVDRMKVNLASWFITGTCEPIVITSSGRGDGKSTVASALAESLAESGKKVLLIDADDKAPTIHRLAGISASPGLLQYLEDPSIDLYQLLKAVGENLTVIPAGGISKDGQSLKHPRFTRLIAELKINFDAIIIDSAECGDSIHSLATPQFDCRWLVIVKLRHSLVNEVQHLATQLDMLPSIERALVVTDVTQKDIKKLRQSSMVATIATAATAAIPTAPITDMQYAESETAAW